MMMSSCHAISSIKVFKTSIKLPCVSLPIFNGYLSNFNHLYSTKIHQNEYLSPEIFTYLVSCLNSEPLNMKGLPVMPAIILSHGKHYGTNIKT